MLTMEKTADYVKRSIAAFESKDLDRVLAFYTDDVVFHSPLIARLSHGRPIDESSETPPLRPATTGRHAPR